MDNKIREEIDEIMAEMEEKTPTSSANMSFENPVANSTKIADDIDARAEPTAAPVSNFFRELLKLNKNDNDKPGKKHPSRPTNERYYDCTNSRVGIAVIFNQIKFKKESERKGSEKDANDLKKVLDKIGFETQIFVDLTSDKIRETLIALSNFDHSDNDCLLITIMTHGERDGIIHSSDGTFRVTDLWEKFIGNNCVSLIGKPKLFFIQACRGTSVDPGILYKPKPKARHVNAPPDMVDARAMQEEERYVIPTLADLLVMYSTSEGFYSFRNPMDGSWFIQAICEELKENSQEELMTILIGVNRRVAFGKQSYVPQKPDWDASKQMPIIQSMLTKSFYFLNREQKEKMKLRNEVD